MLNMKNMWIAILMMIGVYSCGNGNGGTKEEVAAVAATAEPAMALPSFMVMDSEGKQINLQDLKGKKVFVNLWASWCPPCRAEMPSIQKLYEKTQGSNVAFVMLALDNDFNKSLQYMSGKGLILPAYYPAGPLPELFNVPGIPATFIFNEKGQLVRKIEGSDNYNTDEFVKLLTKGV
ncbi:TlpA family protein disulfide reductase [Flavihumibacter stibioxidans]|nr:TlpA disulfide reductase family protein [Flavihumibacter stibioxidans]